MFVKGFYSLNWTHSDFYREFSRFGPIKSAKVSIDKNHLSKGFGYITFEREEDAALAIQEMNKSEVNGAELSVSYNSKQDFKRDPLLLSMSGKFNNLYVKNFPTPDYSESDMSQFFS